eukprot:g1250.t1
MSQNSVINERVAQATISVHKTDVSRLSLLKEKENILSPKIDFDGQRALKAFYHHRPSAPANINFFVGTPRDEFLSSSELTLGDLVEEECLSSDNSATSENTTTIGSLAPWHQMESDTPMRHQITSGAWVTSSGNEKEKRWLKCNGNRPMSFHTIDYASRDVLEPVDWVHLVPSLVRKSQDGVSSTNKQKLSSFSCSKCSPDPTSDQTTTKTDTGNMSGLESEDTRQSILSDRVHYEQLDTDFLETTDDEDNIFHAPYYLGCIGSLVCEKQGSSLTRPDGLVQLNNTSNQRLQASGIVLLQTQSCNIAQQNKKDKIGVNMWSFVRKIATKLCKSPLVKDE